MNLSLLIRRAVAFHWRMHMAVLLGVIVAGTVLTGALLIGDSMRGSLRGLVLERLGNIDQIVIAPNFFRQALASETKVPDGTVEPAIYLPAALAHDPVTKTNATKKTNRLGQVQLLGIQPSFWRFGDVEWLSKQEALTFEEQPALQATGEKVSAAQLPDDSVVLNETTALELGITPSAWQQSVQDQKPLEVIIRVPLPSDIPADSALGRKTETTLSRRCRLVGIIADQGLGRFALQPSQAVPRLGFVSLATLQSLLKQEDKANLLLLSGPRETARNEQENADLEPVWLPKLADFGLRLDELPNGAWQITSDRLIIEPAVEAAIQRWAKTRNIELRPSLVYLANWLEAQPREREPDAKKIQARIPYSTIAAWDPATDKPWGPWLDQDGAPIHALAADEIVVNQWVADDWKQQGLTVKPGDEVYLTFFEPESTHGEVAEQRQKFKLRAIMPMSGPALDRQLTPEMKGITDKKSLTNWNPPFDYEPERVRSVKPNDQDEQYWQEYKATPKAFISYATGQKLWSSRFGQVTSLRFVAAPKTNKAEWEQSLARALPAKELGLTWMPIKAQGLAAAAGTTPFDGLFLGFSLYLIVAAILLIMLLFQLGMERRARELGIEIAQGITRSTLRKQYLGEGLIVATLGACLGVLGGILFAAIMIHGLRTWWVAAIVNPFIELHITGRAIGIGLVTTICVAMLSIWWTLRKLLRQPVRQLLTNQVNQLSLSSTKNTLRKWTIVVCLMFGAIAFIAGMMLSGQSRAGAFFGGALLWLIAIIFWLKSSLEQQARTADGTTQSLRALAWSNACRAPGRSILTLGLMAVAVFLIVAISAFQLQPPPQGNDLHAGDGGFALFAQSDLPLFPDLTNSQDRLDKLGFDDASNQLLERATIIPCRVRTGDDASCLNLYKPRQPRVIGVNENWIKRGGFAWAAKSSLPIALENPWQALTTEPELDATTQQPIYPVILDQNTAMYSLQLYRGIGERFNIDDGTGGKLELVVAGLLQNSLLQGDLLIYDAHFRRIYPQISGSRFFLIEPSSTDQAEQVQAVLEESLSNYGFLVESSRQRLTDLMAVQNTYLSTFQTLGGLGLLLGVVGVAIVQLRNAWERRGELALLQALGFTRVKLQRLIGLEGITLLVVGLALGVSLALLAISPSWLFGGASLPWMILSITLVTILVCGIIASYIAGRLSITQHVVTTLREDGN